MNKDYVFVCLEIIEIHSSIQEIIELDPVSLEDNEIQASDM